MKEHIIAILLMAWLSPISARSYMERAEEFSSDSLSSLVLNSTCSIHWTGSDCRHFWYSTETAEGPDYFLVDTKTWKKTKLFDREAFIEKVNTLAPPRTKNHRTQTLGYHLQSEGYRRIHLFH